MLKLIWFQKLSDIDRYDWYTCLCSMVQSSVPDIQSSINQVLRPGQHVFVRTHYAGFHIGFEAVKEEYLHTTTIISDHYKHQILTECFILITLVTCPRVSPLLELHTCVLKCSYLSLFRLECQAVQHLVFKFLSKLTLVSASVKYGVQLTILSHYK